MENPIKAIYKFQVDAGLTDNGYDDFLETSLLVEEAIEGLSIPNDSLYDSNGERIVEAAQTNATHRTIARDFSRWLIENTSSDVADIDRMDKALDAIVIAIGSLAKLGLKPQDITNALLIVNKYNRKKISMPKDEYGKLTKQEDFIGPEEELIKILRKAKERK